MSEASSAQESQEEPWRRALGIKYPFSFNGMTPTFCGPARSRIEGDRCCSYPCPVVLCGPLSGICNDSCFGINWRGEEEFAWVGLFFCLPLMFLFIVDWTFVLCYAVVFSTCRCAWRRLKGTAWHYPFSFNRMTPTFGGPARSRVEGDRCCCYPCPVVLCGPLSGSCNDSCFGINWQDADELAWCGVLFSVCVIFLFVVDWTFVLCYAVVFSTCRCAWRRLTGTATNEAAGAEDDGGIIDRRGGPVPSAEERKRSIVSATSGDWTEHHDPATGGAVYYFNATTNKTQWACPPGFQKKTWAEHVEPTTGRLYWHCAASGETTWERPVGFEASTPSASNAPPAQAIAVRQPVNPRTFGSREESSMSQV